MSLIDRLKEFNKKKWAKNREKIGEIKNTLQGNGKKNQAENQAENQVNNLSEEVKATEIKVKPQQSVIASTTESIREKRIKMQTEAPAKREAARKRNQDWKKKYDQVDSGKKKLLFLVFLSCSGMIAILLIGFDIWPAPFFKNLEFQQNWSRRDAYVFVETTFVVLILLVPVQIYFMNRLANKIVLKEPEQFDNNLNQEDGVE